MKETGRNTKSILHTVRSMLFRKLTILLLSAVFFTCAGNYGKSVKIYNYSVAVVLIETYSEFYKYINSEEGTYALCRDIIQNHKEREIYDEEGLQRECSLKISELEGRFDSILTACAFSVEALEVADNRNSSEIVENLFALLSDLKMFLENSGIPVSEKLSRLVENKP